MRTLSNKYKAIFLDRDGVINEDYGYVHSWDNFKFCDGAINALKILNSLDFKLIIITNQSGISRGIFSDEDYKFLTSKYLSILKKNNIVIDGVYYCPHHPLFSPKPFNKCRCRKPEPGLFQRAAVEHKISLKDSIALGDKYTDLKAAFSCGIKRRFLIGSTLNNKFEDKSIVTGSFKSLYAFSKFFNNANIK